MFKALMLKILEFYQRYISKILGNNCRYYPSCSEYSKELFLFTNPFVAFLKTSQRLLSCNQLFRGGVDYPKISKKILPIFSKPCVFEYWLIPTKIIPYKGFCLRKDTYPLKTFWLVRIYPTHSLKIP
ncbi:membrane protein insertion efficiency factor YidD [Helicobacter burdigaliensis]|uniref:membrane protein insertion efficiency factor YidD n=1 Tax=Helicobacter burdigaliensis TaxID=2315334 RepID=UPI000EF6D7A7|nr:membrane protein insertion efficiency factor YidD [Helicobacter burdigaliensis]